MKATSVIIDELENALKAGSTQRRIEVLQDVTSLFVNNAKNYTAEQTALFDEVMGRLVEEIENAAIIELSRRLAPIANAPPKIIRQLAWDDVVEISGPVLALSERLTDRDLVELTESKSQSHLVHIAGRRSLNTTVTDALVERGNSDVAKTIAENPDACFSEAGMWQLVKRADQDEGLAERIAARSDVPGHLFRQLVLKATGRVRQLLFASAKPEARRAIEKILGDTSVQFMKAALSRDYANARRKMSVLGQDTERIKIALLHFAQDGELPELISALSILSAVPIELVEQLVHEDDSFGLLVLCKAAALDWTIMHAILSARYSGDELLERKIDEMSTSYLRLSISSAQRALRFWQSHQKPQVKLGLVEAGGS